MLAFCVLPADVSVAGEAARAFSNGVRFARGGQMDFAHMEFRAILKDHPRSRFYSPALFAAGEYFFLMGNHAEARAAFQDYAARDPEASSKMIALAFLWKIADIEKDEAAAGQAVREIVNIKQVSLVFRKSQEYQYLSPMNQHYLAVVHIDHIDIFAGGKLFVEIPY